MALLRSGRTQWLLSCALFAAILLALIVGALIINPLPATGP